MKNLKSELLPARSLAMSGRGDVRVGPILALPAVLTEFGVSPSRAFAQAGVDPRLFEDPDNRMSLKDVGNLLDTCVALTECRHFGLLVGQRFDLNSFGALGLLMRNSATVGDALRDLLMHLHIHDRGAAPVLLAPDSSSVMLGYSIYRHGMPAVAHILDAAIAIAYGILAGLCGPAWRPLRVQLSHSGTGSTGPYRRAFRSRVGFEAEVSGIVFKSSWLGRPIKGADAALHDLVTKAILESEAGDPMSFAEQVEGALPQMVLSGMASSEAIARIFAIHERTLRRRLEAEGKNLQQLINQARFALAQQLLRNTGLSMAAIAVALRYEDPNAFSRAFRAWAKRSPTQWRARDRRSRR